MALSTWDAFYGSFFGGWVLKQKETDPGLTRPGRGRKVFTRTELFGKSDRLVNPVGSQNVLDDDLTIFINFIG